jgi:hypothetical protein
VIPCDYITSWRANVPWVQDFQVEQDLVICHALVEISSKPDLLAALAFRGGTALHKLHIKPPARYPRTSTWSKSRPEQSDKRSRRCGAFAIPEGADLAGEDSPFVAYGRARLTNAAYEKQRLRWQLRNLPRGQLAIRGDQVLACADGTWAAP